MNVRIPVLVTLAVTLAAGCGDDGDRPSAEDAAEAPAVASSEVSTTYSPELEVDLAAMTRLESGLYIQDLEPGDGEPLQAGQTALVHYSGWLPNGIMFDTSRAADRQPYDLVVGAGEVIDGWDQGLEGMRQGGRRKLVIPPSLGYGTRGAGGVIPPGATLVFDVELVEIR